MSAPEAPTIEVVYALPERQTVVRVPLAEGMTALDAVEVAGLLRAHAELCDRPLDIGVFGRPVPPTERLRAGDRVEIYRPLKADPREMRRRLAAEGRSMGPTAGAGGESAAGRRGRPGRLGGG
jgi:uncharacterized protein